MQKQGNKRKIHPPQQQPKPGLEKKMNPRPVFETVWTGPGKKLLQKKALITGGDSGIGRAIAVAFAEQGADVALCYLKKEEKDAQETRKIVESKGCRCLLLPGDIRSEKHCRNVVEKTNREFRGIDILVNNAGTHYPKEHISEISTKQIRETFDTNFFAMFFLVKFALKYMKEGSCIINTSSVTAYRGSAHLIDYSATKGAIVSFTRSLASSLAEEKIRVNAVAPGPVWTPLIVSSMKPKEISTFGTESPMGRPAQPWEIASCFVFLASEEAAYITGQVLHPNGGEIVNG
jgi:NAD(P)-dependent dehydrogenase (short-subunit alcohol dehydrogenase family)